MAVASRVELALLAPQRGSIAWLVQSPLCATGSSSSRSTPAALATLVQRRCFTPPSRRTWSKQHYRIRIPRPMVDGFDLSREQPQKEWWRERRVAPATFFGFPDVTKHGLRGGSLYVEQMDSITLAVLGDKCVKEKVWDPEIWSKFCWRAQQLASRTHEPDLCYIFRAFARADWFDQNFLTTYLGRLQRRLHGFRLLDVCVLLEAFANRKFRQGDYLQKALTHLTLLLQHRDDAKPEELARCCSALKSLRPLPRALAQEVSGTLELLAEALLLRDLSDVGAARAVQTLECYVDWGLVSRDLVGRSSAALDLAWALVRELRGHLRALGHETPDALSALAKALADGGVEHVELWEELTHNLHYEAHRLSGSGAALAVHGVARAGRCTATLYEALGRRLGDRVADLDALSCARATNGLLRGPRALADDFVFRGAIGERILALGLDNFDPEALVILLDGLARAAPSATGQGSSETLGGAVLEALCGGRQGGRLHALSAPQLASVARSLGRLRPSSDVLAVVLDRAHEALTAVSSTPVGINVEDGATWGKVEDMKQSIGEGGAIAPRHVAILFRSIAVQPASILPDVADRLTALLPEVSLALAAEPSASTALSLLGSLGQCPASEARDSALEAAAARVSAKCRHLEATELVALSRHLAALRGNGATSGGAWKPPEALVMKVVELLDMKRYDLPNGALGRAARALELAGAPQGALRLESRDQQ